jgi:manganese transport protein
MNRFHSDQSLSEVHESVDTTTPKRLAKDTGIYRPGLPGKCGLYGSGQLGNRSAGWCKIRLQLIWVLLMSNLMALLLQGLSARLGIVRRRGSCAGQPRNLSAGG